MNELPSPRSLGLCIDDYRPGQPEVIRWLLHPDPTTKAQVLVMPTGGGKSVVEIVAAYLSGLQTYFITTTKQLQAQLLHLDPKLDLMMGQSNYPCIHAEWEGLAEDLIPTVDQAPCQVGWSCPVRESCYYYSRKDRVKYSRATSMNTAVYLTDRRYKGDFGVPAFLIKDEAHRTEEELLSAMILTVRQGDCLAFSIVPPHEHTIPGIMAWASSWEPKVREQKLKLEQQQLGAGLSQHQADRLKRVRTLHRTMVDILEEVGEDNWVVESAGGGHIELRPIFAHEYGELLWGGAGRILAMSATIPDIPYWERSVGLPRYEARVEPSTFDPGRMPIYLDTVDAYLSRATLSSHNSPARRELLCRIDSIMERRTGRRGIIHVPSWEMATWITLGSRSKGRLVLPANRKDQAAILGEWESSPEDAVLVSPSVYEGVDLPYHLNEFQILAKLPWPNRSSPSVCARMKHDRDYQDYSTTLRVMQTVGRSMRAPDDRGETFILDSGIHGLLKRRGEWFAEWFHRAIAPPPERRFGLWMGE